MTNPSIDPGVRLTQFIEGLWASRCVWAAAKLGIADLLANGPKTAIALAEATKTHPPALARLMRALCGIAVFQEDEQGRFGLTDFSQAMRDDAPHSIRATLISELGEVHYPAWGALMHSLQTGKRAFDHVFGSDAWTYFNQHPEVGEIFHRNMTSLTKALDAAVLATYDFGRFKKIIDVGGGHGTMLAHVLQRNKHQSGVVFDQPQVAAGAKEILAKAGVADRASIVSGDFFKEIPPVGADACMMKFILHDWNDGECNTILRNLHKSLPAGATLLLLETVLPGRNEPAFGKFMDINMLVMTGGCERTREEFEKLLAAGGFKLERIVATPSPLCVVEAQQVD